MFKLFPSLRWLLLITALWPVEVFAHQPFESTIEARLQHNRLEIKLTMSQQSAMQLAGVDTGAEAATASTESLLRQLRTQAEALLKVTAGETVMTPQFVEAQFNKLGEWAVVLVFPEPARGRVTIEAVFLQKMPLGYGSTLVVFDENENILTSASALSRQQSSLAWDWPILTAAEGQATKPRKPDIIAPLPASPAATLYQLAREWWSVPIALILVTLFAVSRRRAVQWKRRST